MLILSWRSRLSKHDFGSDRLDRSQSERRNMPSGSPELQVRRAQSGDRQSNRDAHPVERALAASASQWKLPFTRKAAVEGATPADLATFVHQGPPPADDERPKLLQ